MSDRQIQGLTGIDRQLDDGNYMSPAVSRNGALITQDFLLEAALRGRTFHAQQGDATTQLAFTETAYDEDQPQFALRVPAGVTVIPLSIDVTFEDMAGTDTQVAYAFCQNDIGDGTSTALTITPYRTDAPFTSLCTANSLYTGNATAATNPVEFARMTEALAAAATRPMMHFNWDIKTASRIPILVGPATLFGHIIATTTDPEGFAEYAWAEFPTAQLVKAA